MSKKEEEKGNITPPAGEPPAGTGEGDGVEPEKSFTQDELDAHITSRLDKQAKKHEKTMDKAMTDAKADWEKEQKMSEEERLEKQRTERDQKADDRDAAADLRENRITAIEKLTELKLPIDFVDMLADEDGDKTLKNIEIFQKAFAEAVEVGVKAQLDGTAPKDPTKKPDTKPDAKTGSKSFLGPNLF